MSATLDDYQWLVSDAAQPWLTRLQPELEGLATPAMLKRLRKDLSAERVHLVVEQVELRQRAREKFSLADRMFFTRKGLEQATDELLANYKAARFPGAGVFLDYCCGIGGDLLSIAARGLTLGLDFDPICVIFALANREAAKLPHSICGVECQHIGQQPPDKFSAWHCDPDRRVDGHRTTQIDLCEPRLEVLDKLRERNPNAAIKLAPATEVPPHWWDVAEREWLGSRGECRQQVAWFGALTRYPGKHTATVVAADGSSRTVVGSPSEAVSVARQLGQYVYEPHAAVLAAGLTGAMCREHGLEAVSAGVDYLTGDSPVADAALAAFEVREVLPFDRKQLRGWCREHAIGRLEIKKRGFPLDPRQLRSEIIAKGDNEATLILTPLEGHVRAVVAERCLHPLPPIR